MKRLTYIFLFVILGILLQFMVHAFVEIWYTELLLENFSKYGLGLTWEAWFAIHHIATIILFIAGALFGFWQGKFWWRKIYEVSLKNYGRIL